jgi:hypothetical protein
MISAPPRHTVGDHGLRASLSGLDWFVNNGGDRYISYLQRPYRKLVGNPNRDRWDGISG